MYRGGRTTHPGVSVGGGSGSVAEGLGGVFVVDLQAGVVCDVPVGRRGVQG